MFSFGKEGSTAAVIASPTLDGISQQIPRPAASLHCYFLMEKEIEMVISCLDKVELPVHSKLLPSSRKQTGWKSKANH